MLIQTASNYVSVCVCVCVSSVQAHEDPHGDMSISTAVLNMVADLCPHGEFARFFAGGVYS